MKKNYSTQNVKSRGSMVMTIGFFFKLKNRQTQAMELLDVFYLTSMM